MPTRHRDTACALLTRLAIRMAVLLAAMLPPPAGAQQATGHGTSSGDLDRRVSYNLAYSSVQTVAQREDRWLNAIVLWRGPASQMSRRDVTDLARIGEASRRYIELQRAAQDSGRTFIGGSENGVIQFAMMDTRHAVLWVQGQRFPLPQRDSALVVLVDQSGEPEWPATVVGTGYIPALLPDGFWTRSWRSGDTTFFVRPRQPTDVLRRTLELNPAVRAFLAQ